MPGKSKKGKTKRYQQIKKTNNIQRQDTVAAAATAVSTAPKAAATARTAPAVKASGATANAIANQYVYVPGDLRRIGILTGIIVVILIVLYFVLR
jgi:predicted exporter